VCERVCVNICSAACWDNVDVCVCVRERMREKERERECVREYV